MQTEQERTRLEEEECLTSFPVIIDRDPCLNFETDGILKKIILYPIRMLLNMLPPNLGGIVFTAFSGPRGDTTIVRNWAPTYRAIEVAYSYPERKIMGQTNFSDDFWENFLLSARGVRNRLKIVKRELTKLIFYFLYKKEKVYILSVGSGSARGIIEVLSELNYSKDLIKVKCIDFSRRALQFAKNLANLYRVDNLETYKDNVFKIGEYCKDSDKPNIIEMVGLFDYYKGKEAVELIQKCYEALSLGGYLIISNAVPNIEAPFFTKGMNWRLVYRTPQELGEILLKANFKIRRIIQEPLRVHVIIIAQKDPLA